MRARKKPIVIEFIRYNNDNLLEVIEFCNQKRKLAYINRHNEQLYISTPYGKVLITDGDYIIKGIESEFYPCKPNIFMETYEVLEGPEMNLNKQAENYLKQASILLPIALEKARKSFMVIKQKPIEQKEKDK